MQCLYLKICIFCFPTHKDYKKCHCIVTRDLPLKMFINIFSITVILNLDPKIISINENPQSDIKYQCYSSHFPNVFLHYTDVFFLGFTAEIFRDFLHNEFPEYSIFNSTHSKACPGHIFRIHIIVYYQLSTLYLIFSIMVSLLKLENWILQSTCVGLYNSIGSRPRYDNFWALADANPPI